MGTIGAFLNNMAMAWEAGTEEQRNHLAVELFERVWVKDGLVKGVTSRPEMVPFFDLCTPKLSTNGCTGGPDGVWCVICQLCLRRYGIDNIEERRHFRLRRHRQDEPVFYPHAIEQFGREPVPFFLTRRFPGQGQVVQELSHFL